MDSVASLVGFSIAPFPPLDLFRCSRRDARSPRASHAGHAKPFPCNDLLQVLRARRRAAPSLHQKQTYDESEPHHVVGALTTTRRVAMVPGLEWAVAACSRAPSSSPESACVVQSVTGGVLIAVVDNARCDARRAVSLLASARTLDVIPLLRLCTDLIPRTYGLVRGLASCNTSTGRMTWLGVSKFSGHIMRAQPLVASDAELHITRGGTHALRLPPIRPFRTKLETGDVLVLSTDQMERGIAHDVSAHETAQDIATRILASQASATSDTLVFAGRYLGAPAGHS